MFSCILILTNQKGDAYLGPHPNISFKSMVRLSTGLHAFCSTAHAEPDFYETSSEETFHETIPETTLQTLI